MQRSPHQLCLQILAAGGSAAFQPHLRIKHLVQGVRGGGQGVQRGRPCCQQLVLLECGWLQAGPGGINDKTRVGARVCTHLQSELQIAAFQQLAHQLAQQ